QPKLGLWYPKDSPFDLVAYTNSDYAGASLDRKSTTGDLLTKAFDVYYESGLALERTKTLATLCAIQLHPISVQSLARLLSSVYGEQCINSTYLLTKAFDNGIGVNAGDSKFMLLGINLLLLGKVNAARHKLTAAREIYAVRHKLTATGEIVFLAKPTKSEGFEQVVDFLNAHTIKYALTINPTIYTSCIEQFWATVKVKTVNREQQLQALVDGKKIIITEETIRRDLQLEDVEGIDYLPNADIFEQLTLMSAKTTIRNEFSSTMDSAIIYLATNQKFNFSKYIFESIVKNLDNVGKFLMYPRQGKDFSRRETTLFPTMMVQAQEEMGEGLEVPTDPHHTPIITQPSSSQPQRKQKSKRSKRKDTEGDYKFEGDTSQIVRAKGEERNEKRKKERQRKKKEEKKKKEEEERRRHQKREQEEVHVKEVSDVGKVNTASITTTVTTTKGILLQEPSESITTTTTTTIPSKDKGKGIMVEEPLKIKKKDQISFDEQEAIRLQAEFDDEVRADGSETREDSISKRAGDELEQENAKKQKVDDNQEADKMKELMKIVPDEKEVAVDAIPLATKPPSIVDYKIIKEGKISYYQIIRADGSSKRYSAFIQMLRSFEREDLETL
ncbi:hypothetical protein Tco_1258291, partial [Tanacetum coccineum]